MAWMTRAATALVGLFLAGTASAWGDKPVKLIVPAPAGGSMDIVARIIGQQLAADIGQPVVVDNRPGAGGAIGIQAMLQAPADGNTLMITANNVLVEIPHVIKVPYDPLKDVVPVATFARAGLVLVSASAFPAKDFKSLIAQLKARQGKSSFASYSVGTVSHYAGMILNQKAGLDMQHVGFAGSPPALQQIMGGQVDVMFDGMLTSLPLIKAGKVRPYAFTGNTRSVHLPAVPTMLELGYPDIQFSGWLGLIASKSIPPEVLRHVQLALSKSAQSPAVRQKLLDVGLEPDINTNTPELQRELKQTSDRNAAIVKQFEIKLN